MNRNMTITFLGMAMTAGVGVIAGWAIGDLTRRHRHGLEQFEALRHQLQQHRATAPFPERQLREMRGDLNDLHKMVRAVTKTLEKRPS